MSQRVPRSHRTIGILGLLVVLCLALIVPVTSALASGSGADATNGQTLFQANCASCHGANAAGGIKVGSTTSPDVRWSAIGSTFKDPTLVRRAILSGLDEEGKPLDAAMPHFANKLTNSQADDIVAYLQTLTSGLPNTGDPIGEQSLPWIALAAGLVLIGGIKLRRVAR